MGIPCLCYAITCQMIHLLTDRLPKRGIIVIGFFIAIFCMLLIGGKNLITAYDEVTAKTLVTGLCVFGASMAFVSVPILPEMMEAYEEDENLSKNFSKESVENTVSGISVSASSLGEFIGPLISS